MVQSRPNRKKLVKRRIQHPAGPSGRRIGRSRARWRETRGAQGEAVFEVRNEAPCTVNADRTSVGATMEGVAGRQRRLPQRGESERPREEDRIRHASLPPRGGRVSIPSSFAGNLFADTYNSLALERP